jgi:FMN phosphatase YigB (HAD superfamily)
MHHIAFDLGNVLVNVDMQPFWKAVDHLGVRKDDVERLLKLYDRIDCCGNVNMIDVFTDELDDELEANYLFEAWCSGVYPDDQMCNFLASLSSEGFKIAYLSNIGTAHLNHLRSKYSDFMDCASVPHMSCEVGVAKPAILFYQSFLMQNDEFAGCTYLDDLQSNLQVASKCKFDSIYFNLNELKTQKPSVLKRELIRIKERLLRGC